ncbi:MAG: glycosyltransferase [Williamsia sp.]|nr:glycosyltransferase [Williamsia sp.]
MKVSIITTTFNSAATVASTLESVQSQTHPSIEHIIVDGASSDETLSIVRSFPHVARLVSEPDKGLYDAINKGIRISTGDIIGILNSDDFFPDNRVVEKIVQAFDHPGTEAIIGDIAFIRPGNLKKVIRLYSAKKFSPAKFAYGYMPPHPSFYARKELYDTYGLYKQDYKIAADYELLMRFIYRHKISYRYINQVLVYMRTGGISNKSWRSRYVLNKEIIRACKENGVQTNMAVLSVKYINKIFEYIKPALIRGE